jgi:hypothetical protein
MFQVKELTDMTNVKKQPETTKKVELPEMLIDKLYLIPLDSSTHN